MASKWLHCGSHKYLQIGMRVLKVPIELQLVISKACWYLYFHLKSLYHFSQQKKTILG